MSINSKKFSPNFLEQFYSYYELFQEKNINLNVNELFLKINKLSDNNEKKLLLEYVIFKLIERDNINTVKEINNKLNKNKLNNIIKGEFKLEYMALL